MSMTLYRPFLPDVERRNIQQRAAQDTCIKMGLKMSKINWGRKSNFLERAGKRYKDWEREKREREEEGGMGREKERKIN